MNWIVIEDYGIVMAQRVVALGRSDSAPMRRLVEALPLSKVIGMTGGRRRRSVIVLDSGHVVLTALPVARLELLLQAATNQQHK